MPKIPLDIPRRDAAQLLFEGVLKPWWNTYHWLVYKVIKCLADVDYAEFRNVKTDIWEGRLTKLGIWARNELHKMHAQQIDEARKIRKIRK